MLNDRLMKWTPSAIMCYKRGGVCRGCEVDELMKESKRTCKGRDEYNIIHRCNMKAVITELTRVLGRPTDEMLNTIY